MSTEQKDFIKCEECGLMFDPADLANVFAHEHDNQTILESGKYLGQLKSPDNPV